MNHAPDLYINSIKKWIFYHKCKPNSKYSLHTNIQKSSNNVLPHTTLTEIKQHTNSKSADITAHILVFKNC